MLLKFINIILFFCIQCIEKIQYRNVIVDQDDPLHKIKNIIFTDKKDLWVDSPQGWVKVEEINETQPFKIWYIKTDKGKKLYCADTHILFNELGHEVFVQDLKIGDYVQTKDGYDRIIDKYSYNKSNSMIDLSVQSNEMQYYSNNIVCHNTVCAAIVLLHYAIFNTNKGIMIVANKAETVVEIIDKIKNIYKLLPFYLKPGIINWNTRTIVFENGCRIKSQARSKEPAIGFTIDFLYIDEFAHIPPNTITHYYKSVVPTVSSISGSKIVITSTPNGANLFKDLVVGAGLEEGHPDKNQYKLVKVYWYQVPDGRFEDNTRGTRFDAKIYPMEHELRNRKLTIEDLNKSLRKLGHTTAIDIETTDAGDRKFIRVKHENNKSEIDKIRALTIGEVELIRISNITNWKEQETKLIGGEEAFNQEYGLQFIAGSKRVLSANVAKILEDRSCEYDYREVEVLDRRLKIEYEQLRFAPDFNEATRNQYHWLTVADISEGLGLDDTVINWFRLMPRSKEWLETHKIKSLHDAFYYKQSMIYNYNRINHKTDLADFFYLMNFEYLDPQKVKAVVEYNGPGSSFLTAMPFVFNQKNQYGNYPFVRYYHNQRDKKKKVGIKVTRNKKELVKSYTVAIEEDRLYVDERKTLEQMDSFIKVETRSGDYTYRADSGHDDIVMTLVTGSTFLETQDFKNVCYSAYKDLNSEWQRAIDAAMDLNYNPDPITYKSVGKAISNLDENGNRAHRFQGGTGRFVRKPSQN